MDKQLELSIKGHETNGSWVKWDLPDGYEFQDKDGNVINTNIIKLVKKQPKYPTTYEECCQHLGCDDKLSAGKLLSFQQLINARNAYWKIAGEEMGLDEPWKPDYNHNTEKYVIYPYQYLYSIDKEYYRNTILAFPTAEMRDVFYENFEKLINDCKEFL